MKTKFADFILSGGVLALILGMTLAVLDFGLSPWVHACVGDYYTIVNVLLFLLLYGLISGIVLQLMLKIRPLPTGEFSMESSVFTYWKLLSVMHLLAQGALTPFTSVFTAPLTARLFGARIGSNVALAGTIGEPFMVTVEDGVILGQGSLIAASVLADGKIIIGKVRIGAGATIGVYSVAMGDIDIGEHAKLLGGAMILPGTRVPAGEVWRGNPARKWLGNPATAKVEAVE